MPEHAVLAIPIVGATFGVAAFGATAIAGTARRFGMRPLLATLLAACVGAFAASRHLSPEALAVSALVTSAFAAAFAAADRTLGSRAFLCVAVVLGIVAIAVALDGMWLPLSSGLVASLPFLLTALVTPKRERPIFDAMLAAIAGVALGFVSAYLAIFVACLAAVVIAKVRRVALADVEFATSIAACGTAAMLINVSLQT